MIAGGVESMSRAPFVMSKSDAPFGRQVTLEDTTLGWRFVNPEMQRRYGIDSMAETAENVAAEHAISRADQDRFALRSQQRAGAAQQAGRLAEEIVPVEVTQKKAAGHGDAPTNTRVPTRRSRRWQSSPARAPRRHGHCGQRVWNQRRRLCVDRRLGGGGPRTRPHAARARRGLGGRRRGAARHGHRAGARRPSGSSRAPA